MVHPILLKTLIYYNIFPSKRLWVRNRYIMKEITTNLKIIPYGYGASIVGWSIQDKQPEQLF